MPTIPNNKNLKTNRAPACALLLLFAALPCVAARQPQKTGRWSLALDAAFFLPTQRAVRDVYPDAGWPLTFRLSLAAGRHIGFYAGCRYLQARGSTRLLTNQGLSEESFRTDLKVYGPQLGAIYRLSTGSLDLRLGGGLSYHFYREEWRNAPHSFSGETWGFQGEAVVAYPLGSRFAIFFKLSYLSIPTGKGSLLEANVNLGGLQAGLGLGFHI